MEKEARKPAQSTEAATRELSDEQLDEVAGGLNPQPLPPRVWAVRLPDDYTSFFVGKTIKFF